MLEQQASEESVLGFVTQILTEITWEWDVDDIGRDTRLGDTGVESIALVYLIAEIQQHFDLGDVVFERLRSSGSNLTQLRVGDLTRLLVDLIWEWSGNGGRQP
jgi:hypothetical protein